MKKISIVLIIAAFAVLMACSYPGPDLNKNKSELVWSFIKSPQTDACYEVFTMNKVTGVDSVSGYAGMERVDDKYCIGK